MFEDNLKKLMKEKKMTHQKLGEAIGLSGSAVSMMVTGERKPSYESLNAICKELGTTPNYLMGFDEDITDQDRAILRAVKSVAGIQQQAESNSDSSKQVQISNKERK